MNIYTCSIRYTSPGETCGNIHKKNIWVRAKDILEAYKKSLQYREKGEVKKVVEIRSVEFSGSIDKE